MKKFKVIAHSTIMDIETNVRYEHESHAIFEKFRNSGTYHSVYIMDNETGEVYRTYDMSEQAGGVMIQEWYTLG